MHVKANGGTNPGGEAYMADALPIKLIGHTIEETVISCHSQRSFDGKNSLQVNLTSLPVAEGRYLWLSDHTRG